MAEQIFDEFGVCERCGKESLLNPLGACEACIVEMRSLKDDPELRQRRFKDLNKSENGIIRSAILDMRRSTSQRDVPIRSKLERKAHHEMLGEMSSLRAALEAKPEELTLRRKEDSTIPLIVSGFDNLLKELKRHPDEMHNLTPRAFEEFIAELLKNMGYEVTLTPQTRDGGRDILAVFPTPIGPRLTLVECKRYAKHHAVGLSVVERFLYVLRDKDKASSGLIATTSRFAKDAIKEAAKYSYQLTLADRPRITEWLESYGRWNEHKGSNIWIPE